MRFMYWCRMHELVRKRVKVPNTMLVRHEMVMYLHEVEGDRGGLEGRGEGEGTELGTYVGT